MGGLDADDVLAFLDGLLAEESTSLDPERVGVMGGSCGGYLTAMLTTRTDRFVAAVVERGYLDSTSFVGSSDIGWFFPCTTARRGRPATRARCRRRWPTSTRSSPPDAGDPLRGGLAVSGRARSALVHGVAAAWGGVRAVALPRGGSRAQPQRPPEPPAAALRAPVAVVVASAAGRAELSMSPWIRPCVRALISSALVSDGDRTP